MAICSCLIYWQHSHSFLFILLFTVLTAFENPFTITEPQKNNQSTDLQVTEHCTLSVGVNVVLVYCLLFGVFLLL